MALIETWYEQDLKQPVGVHYIDGNVFSQDNNGNLIGVRVYDEGETATLSGTVSASIIRADGVTVAAVGSLSGNAVSVILPQAAYEVPGPLSVVIKLVGGGSTTTLCAAVANVYRSETDSIIDPGTIIPSIDALIAEIQAAVASIPADYSELWKSLAPNFNTSTNYDVGRYVTYNGGLYEFKSYHPAGTWNSAHVTKVDLGYGVSEIKNALDRSGIFPVTVERGSINTSGVEQADNARLRTGFIDVSNVDYINVILETDFRIAILYYNADGSYAGSASDWGDVRTTTRWFDVSTRSLIRCVLINKNPPSGYVMPYEVAQNNYVIVYKSINNYIASFLGHYLEEDSDGIYLKWTNNIWLRGSIVKTLPISDNSGLTLVSSPLGISNCVYIENNKSLVFNSATQALAVIDTENLRENSPVIPLLSVITMYNHKGKTKGLLVDVIADTEKYYIRENATLSLTYEVEPYFEYSGANGGVYFSLNGGKGWIRGFDTGRNWNDMESIPFADGITLTTSPMGKTNCLHIPHNYSLIWIQFENKYYLVPNADMWKYPYSVLFFQVIGNKGHDDITKGIGKTNIKFVNDAGGIQVDNGNIFYTFNSSFNSVGEHVEPFLFFSDPHVMGRSNEFDAGSVTDFVNALRFGYENAPTSFIFDGGDWLNQYDYQSYACYKLGLIDGIMRKNFEKYYPANGNHDINLYGYVSADDSSTGTLSEDVIKALHYREDGGLYYSFDGTITKNYVFDSWSHHETAMNSYRWEQVDWFANKLIADDSPYGVVWVHVAFTDYTTFDPTQFSTFMTNVASVIAAYNARQSITLNGQTYNFSGKTGKVWAIMCGHTHYDMTGTLEGVPVISVINAINNGVVSYDLGYFDFDNSVLKTFRIGNGSNRVINL